MTSFPPNEKPLTGTDVPGGALRKVRVHAGMNLVLAPFGSASSPVPTNFQLPARLSGGTVANREGSETKQGRGAMLAEIPSRHRLPIGRFNGIGAPRVGGPRHASLPKLSRLSA